MNATVIALRKEAARILLEDRVDVVIGFAHGTLPLTSRPVFIRRPDAANDLIINGFCSNNLASYLTRRPSDERIGIVCRGCESRAVRALVIEQQHSRERLYIIGIPCPGILDTSRILAGVGEDVQWIRETGDTVVVGTRSGERRFNRTTLLDSACSRCRFPDPVGADIVLGTPAADSDGNARQSQVDALGDLDAGQRHAFFAAETGRCIRCYACREACPMCYCTQCFVDHTTPRWTESTISPAGAQAWHLIRAFHQTGRCVACGACERACPMNIRMTYLTDKLNQDVANDYGFIVGQDDRRQPPFATFSRDDANRFER
jgi:formate dehydrogenase subunit beta